MASPNNLLPFVAPANKESAAETMRAWPKLSPVPASSPDLSEGESEAIEMPVIAPGSPLQRITDAALQASGADGAALALQHEDAVECMARSGELAPPQGARLDVNSGISGESFRRIEAVCCNDTEDDPRVDREVCRALGLRSIAIAPVREGNAAIGILEVLSTRAHAFTDKHLEVLRQLAEFAASESREMRRSAEVRGATVAGAVVAEPAPVPVHPLLPAPVVARGIDAELFATLPADEKEPFRWKRIALVSTGILAAVSLFGWALWYRSNTARSKPAATAPAPAVVQPVPEPVATAPSNPGTTAAQVVPTKKQQVVLTQAAENDVVTRHLDAPKPVQAPAAQESDAPPSAPVPEGTNDDARQLVSGLITAPGRVLPSVPVSQGVSGGAIMRRIAPTYPAQAKKMRVEGRVIVRAEVAEDGSVQQVVAISGPPLLVDAAVNAVRQWQYQPYLLNGTPVRRETRINVDFKLP